MSRKRVYGQRHIYKRRSQIYDSLRTRRLSSGSYLVEHEPSAAEFIVFKRVDDWAVVSQQGSLLRTGFRKKDDIMEVLSQAGPEAL